MAFNAASSNAQFGLDLLRGGSSKWGGTNTIKNVYKNFGISPDASAEYAPLKKALAGQRSTSVNRTLRTAGRSATPGMTASGVEESFANALQGLLGQQGRQSGMNRQFAANLLGQSYGAQDAYGLNRANSLVSGGTGLMGAYDQHDITQDQLNPGFFGVLGKILQAGGSIAAPFAMMSALGGGGGNSGGGSGLMGGEGSGLEGSGMKPSQMFGTGRATPLSSPSGNRAPLTVSPFSMRG